MTTLPRRGFEGTQRILLRARRLSSAVRRVDGTGDRVLYALCAAAGVLSVLVLAEVLYQVISGAQPAIWRTRSLPCVLSTAVSG